MPDEKIYNVEEANAMLPWLVKQLEDAAELADKVEKLRAVVAELEGLSRSNGHGDIDSRLSDARTQQRSKFEEFGTIMDALDERRIQVRDIERGLIDFPGEREGKEVWLCWEIGESEVGYWHEIDTGFINRQPL